MLRLVAAQAETLWDEALPIEVRVLPDDLAALDGLLCGPGLLAPFVEHWQREAQLSGVSAADHGRPTLAIETYVRLMVLKHRHGWGYRSLVAEVSDSIHLRRFCRIALTERVPDESTVRKLTRRIGEQTVNDITRELIEAAVRERRFRARAVRIDSTVIEADIKYPTDAGLASHGVRSLAREGRKLAAKLSEEHARVRDRSRSMGRKLRAISRTIRRRSGEAKAEVLALTEQTGQLLAQSITEARRLAATARRKARGRGAQAKLRAAAKLDELADRCEKVATQIKQRVRRREDHRPADLALRSRRQADPQGQARQAQRVRLRRADRRDHPEHQARRTRTDPAGRFAARQPRREPVAPADRRPNSTRLGLSPREVALDGGFTVGPTTEQLKDLDPERVFISGRQQPGSRRTQRRLQRYRTGAEGRISHLKRGYGMRRSRLKGDDGQKTWTGWGILAYNLDTLTIRTA